MATSLSLIFLRFSSSQVLVKEGGDFVKGNLVHVVIKVCVAGTGNDKKFLVVSFKSLECIFQKITGMSFFTMNHEDRALVRFHPSLELRDRG